jgi:hypothetical protein
MDVAPCTRVLPCVEPSQEWFPWGFSGHSIPWVLGGILQSPVAQAGPMETIPGRPSTPVTRKAESRLEWGKKALIGIFLRGEQ